MIEKHCPQRKAGDWSPRTTTLETSARCEILVGVITPMRFRNADERLQGRDKSRQCCGDVLECVSICSLRPLKKIVSATVLR